MVCPLKENTVTLDIYKAVASALLEGDEMKELIDGVIIDFDFFKNDSVSSLSSTTTTEQHQSTTSGPMPIFVSPTNPQNPPRMYLLPTSLQYPKVSSCNDKMTLELQVVLDGFSVRSEQFHRLAFCVAKRLRRLPVTFLKDDGTPYPVICEPGSGSFEFDSERQTMNFSMQLSVSCYI